MKTTDDSDKLVYKLDEVSRITKLDTKIIESWEKEFYFIQSGQTGAGHKIFRKKDLAIIQRLKELVENEGLTLAGAKRKVAKRSARASPSLSADQHATDGNEGSVLGVCCTLGIVKKYAPCVAKQA